MSNKVWAPVSASTDWGATGNWGGSIPASADSVFLQNVTTGIDTGLSQSGVTLTDFDQYQNFVGPIGTSSTYLNIGATTFNLGIAAPGGGSNPSRLNINAANSGAAVNIFSSGTIALDAGYAPIRLLGISLALSATGGTYCVAMAPGETSSISTLNQTQGSGTPTGTLGIGVTLTTGSILAGVLNNYSSASSNITISNGASLNHFGTGGYGTLTVNALSTCEYVGTGTITNLYVTGTLDLSQGTGAVTVTNCTVYAGATINDPGGRLTFTNPLQLAECTLKDVSLHFGWNRHYQVS